MTLPIDWLKFEEVLNDWGLVYIKKSRRADEERMEYALSQVYSRDKYADLLYQYIDFLGRIDIVDPKKFCEKLNINNFFNEEEKLIYSLWQIIYAPREKGLVVSYKGRSTSQILLDGLTQEEITLFEKRIHPSKLEEYNIRSLFDKSWKVNQLEELIKETSRNFRIQVEKTGKMRELYLELRKEIVKNTKRYEKMINEKEKEVF